MKRSPFNLKQVVLTNPVTVIGLVCLMLVGVLVQSDPLVIRSELFFGLALAGALWARHLVPWEKQYPVFFVVFFIGSFTYHGVVDMANPVIGLLLVGFVAIIAFGVYFALTKQMTVPRFVLLCMAAGFLLRLCYVLYTPVWERQHDVWHFSYGEFTDFTYQRHAEYIEYIATYLKLPAQDPTAVGLSQLYHPPFHHLLAGLWLRLQWLMGIDRGVSYENIQFLTLFYSSACMVVGYRLLKILGCKRWGLVLPMAILCFHPTFIIMAGSINNDLLSITLALYGVYAAVRWYKDPTLYHIITVALGVGLSMMTKLSGGLVAPGIAVLFLAKWPASAVDKKQFARLFWQFGVFALICIPVALWWPVKNAVLYQVPITFVPSLSENSGQYLGQYTTAQRLFELPKESFSQIFMAWQNQTAAVPYNEYNLFLSLMKTSVFGEFTLFTPHLFPNTWQHLWGVAASKTLFWSNILLAILSLYAGVLCLVRCRKRIVPWALLAIWVVVTFGYVRFCFAYPQACTQNFRYAVPTLMCGLAALGGWTSHSTKTFKILVAMATGVFCLASTATYGLLGTIG